MSYQPFPRYDPNYGNKYGFRQKPAPTLGVPGASAPPTQLASSTETRLNDYSGTSAENMSSNNQTIDQGDGGDSNTGPGTTLSGKPVEETIPASYASPLEAWQYGKAAFDSGYYGSVGEAAKANQQGNLAARGALQGFLAAGPTGEKKAPGTLGFIATKLNNAYHGGPQYDMTNINTSLDSLSKDGGDGLGSLYSTDIENNSSGYFGDTTFEQQTVSDLDAAKTYGHFQTEPTVQQLQGPEIFHDPADSYEVQQQEQQANYDHYQDNSSDDNHGQTDGTQTGGETSHAGGYGGFADDTAATNSDSGGGGGGK